MTVDFAYSLGSKVKLVDIQMSGRVESLMRDSDGCQYWIVNVFRLFRHRSAFFRFLKPHDIFHPPLS